MPKTSTLRALTVDQIKKIVAQGKSTEKNSELHFVGGAQGLYLELRGPGSASYIFRYTYQGKRRVFSLGPWHLLSLQDARLKAQQLQARVFAGEDVKTKARRQQELEQHKQELEKQPVNKNFSYIVDLWIRSRVEANFWKNNVKGERDTRQKLEKWVYPVIGDRDIEEVDARDMERLFAPIWQSHPSTASKILCWVRKIFQWAIAQQVC